MKTSESKTHTQSSVQKQQNSPFFQKEGGEFNSEAKNAESTSFFQASAIQAKLKIGQPNDKFEQEADRMADQVVQKLNNPATEKTPANTKLSSTPSIQTKCSKCAQEEQLQKKEEEFSEDEESIQRKPIFESEGDPPIRRKPIFESEGDPTVQRKCSKCESEEKIQQKSEGPSANNATTLQSQLNASKGRGNPLSKSTRNSMESAFGTDFSGVRIHTGSNAIQMSQDLNAKAFTHGSDIYFNQGNYNTGSSEGQHLLAHELTHTVQQNGNHIAKAENDDSNTTPSQSTEVNKEVLASKEESEYGKIYEENGEIKMELFNFKLKSNINPGVGGNMPGPPYTLQSPDTNRNTKQKSVWRRGLRAVIKSQLESLAGSGARDRQKYVLELNYRRADTSIVGTISQLTNAVLVPFWNIHGRPTTYQIEHLIDWQLAGTSVVDHLENLILLDASANIGLGQTVKSSKEAHIRKVLKHYNGNDSENGANLVTTGVEALRQYNITIDLPFNSRGIRVIGDVITASQIINQKTDRNPFHKDHIRIRNFDVPKEGHFLLKTSKRGAGYMVPYSAKGYKAGSFSIYVEGDVENHQITSLTLIPEVDPKYMSKKSLGDVYEVEEKSLDVFMVKGLRNKLRNLFELQALSPIELDENEMEIDDDMVLRAKGLVKSTISFLEDLDIGIDITGEEFSIIKDFNITELAEKIPEPFKVNNSTLELIYNSKKGLSLVGRVMFEIGGVGEGYVRASVRRKGLTLDGSFDFDNNWFSPANVNISYEEGEWSFSGEVGLKAGKVKGIKKALLKVSYKDKKFNAKGTAHLDVPGIKKGEVFAEYDRNSGAFNIYGDLELKDNIKGIEKGSIKVKIARESEVDDWKLYIKGEIESKIPGIPSVKLQVSYDDGVFIIQGRIRYSKGIVDGYLEAGVTNQAVDEEGNPLPEQKEKLTPFGSGNLKVIFGKYVQGTIGGKLTQEGEIELHGGIKNPDRVALTQGRFVDIDHTLYESPKIKIPIPGLSLSAFGKTIGISLEIFGGVRFQAEAGPLYLNELELKTDSFKPEDPGSTIIEGSASLEVPAKAILKVYLNANARLNIIVDIKPGLIGSINLIVEGKAKGGIKVQWSKDKGLQLIDAMATINANAELKAALEGYLDIDLDLWLTTIDLYYEKWTLGSMSLGKSKNFEVGFPLTYEDNEPGKLDFEDLDVDKPNYESMGEVKNLASQAMGEATSPPPPPSKEEIRIKIRQLGPGAVISDEMFEWLKDIGEEEIIKNANRESYYKWLKKTYPDMNFNWVRGELNTLDRQEFEKFKNELRRVEKLNDIEKRLRLYFLVEGFKEGHPFFPEEEVDRYGEMAKKGELWKEENISGSLQFKSDISSPNSLPDISTSLNSSKGKGDPLPENVLPSMNTAFNTDLKKVRIHNDKQAHQMNEALGAHAFTHGQDIYFNKDSYNPNSSKGKHLLAHELTHTVQQGGGDIKRQEDTEAVNECSSSTEFDQVEMCEVQPQYDFSATSYSGLKMRKEEVESGIWVRQNFQAAFPAEQIDELKNELKAINAEITERIKFIKQEFSSCEVNQFDKFSNFALMEMEEILEDLRNERLFEKLGFLPSEDASLISEENVETTLSMVSFERFKRKRKANAPLSLNRCFSYDNWTFLEAFDDFEAITKFLDEGLAYASEKPHLKETLTTLRQKLYEKIEKNLPPEILTSDLTKNEAYLKSLSPDEALKLLYSLESSVTNIESKDQNPALWFRDYNMIIRNNMRVLQWYLEEEGIRYEEIVGRTLVKDPKSAKDLALDPVGIRYQLKSMYEQDYEFRPFDIAGIDPEYQSIGSRVENLKYQLFIGIHPPGADPIALATMLDEQYAALKHEKETFLSDFKEKAEEVVLNILQASENKIKAEKIKYGLTEEVILPAHSGPGIDKDIKEYGLTNPAEVSGLAEGARRLAEKSKAIDGLEDQLESLTLPDQVKKYSPFANSLEQMGAFILEKIDEEAYQQHLLAEQKRRVKIAEIQEELKVKKEEYLMARLVVESEFPILATWASKNDTGTLEKISRGVNGESISNDMAKIIGTDLDAKLANIKKVRSDLHDGDIEIWEMYEILDLTRNVMKVPRFSIYDTWIWEKRRSVREDKDFWDTFLVVLSIGLGILAIPLTAGTSALAVGAGLAVGATALAIDVHLLAKSYQEYSTKKAMAGTDFDPALSLSQEDPSLLWLALDIIGIIPGIGELGTGAKALFKSLKKPAKEFAEELAKEGAEQLVRKKRSELLEAAAKQGNHGGKLSSRLAHTTESMIIKSDIHKAKKAAVEELTVNSVAKQINLGGGRKVTLTQDGRIFRCSSPCTEMGAFYADVLIHRTDLLDELENLQFRMFLHSDPERFADDVLELEMKLRKAKTELFITAKVAQREDAIMDVQRVADFIEDTFEQQLIARQMVPRLDYLRQLDDPFKAKAGLENMLRDLFKMEEVTLPGWAKELNFQPSGLGDISDQGMQEIISKIKGKAPNSAGIKGDLGEFYHASQLVDKLPPLAAQHLSYYIRRQLMDKLIAKEINIVDFMKNFPEQGARQLMFNTIHGRRYIDHAIIQDGAVLFRESKNVSSFKITNEYSLQIDKDLELLEMFPGSKVEWTIFGKIDEEAETLLKSLERKTNGRFSYKLGKLD